MRVVTTFHFYWDYQSLVSVSKVNLGFAFRSCQRVLSPINFIDHKDKAYIFVVQ